MNKMRSSQGYFSDKMMKILEKGEEKATVKKTSTVKRKTTSKKKGK